MTLPTLTYFSSAPTTPLVSRQAVKAAFMLPCADFNHRSKLYAAFEDEHRDGLTHLYRTTFTFEQRERCSLNEWLWFVFQHTSTNALQTYTSFPG